MARYPTNLLEWTLCISALATALIGFGIFSVSGLYYSIALRREGMFARTDIARQLRISWLKWALIGAILLGCGGFVGNWISGWPLRPPPLLP